MNPKALRNVADLVSAGIKALRADGWTDEKIISLLPVLRSEAVAFLAKKGA